MLPNCSHEQQNVIDNIEANNVIVDAVAGSGKTTCVLYIAKKFSSAKILLLTYSNHIESFPTLLH